MVSLSLFLFFFSLSLSLILAHTFITLCTVGIGVGGDQCPSPVILTLQSCYTGSDPPHTTGLPPPGQSDQCSLQEFLLLIEKEHSQLACPLVSLVCLILTLEIQTHGVIASTWQLWLCHPDWFYGAELANLTKHCCSPNCHEYGSSSLVIWFYWDIKGVNNG